MLLSTIQQMIVLFLLARVCAPQWQWLGNFYSFTNSVLVRNLGSVQMLIEIMFNVYIRFHVISSICFRLVSLFLWPGSW